MKAYRSIDTRIDYTRAYHLFDKLDGSNLRAEWSPKQGFYKFGSRTQLLTPDQAPLYPFVAHFHENLADELDKRFRTKKFERAVVFSEWHGPKSGFGSHHDPVSEMKATLIDIDVYKKGLMLPEHFLDFTAGLSVPALLHKGRIDVEMFHAVRERTMPGITFEGVVGKGEFSQKEGGPIMFKIKTNDWLNKLREFCNGDEQMFNRLK